MNILIGDIGNTITKICLIKNKTLELLENKKFHEYYNYKTGDCLGANNFSWSAALYLDLKLNN